MIDRAVLTLLVGICSAVPTANQQRSPSYVAKGEPSWPSTPTCFNGLNATTES